MKRIIAQFFVGLSGGIWEKSPLYYGFGNSVDQAGHDALSKCAVEYRERPVAFLTFAVLQESEPHRIERINEGSRLQ